MRPRANRDDAAAVVGDAIRVPLPTGRRPDAIALAGSARSMRWLATRSTEGPHVSVIVLQLDEAGAVISSTEVTRGGVDSVRLGEIVATPSGGAAVSYRGDEGLAWITSIDRRGRTTNSQFFDACLEAPSLALDPLDGDRIVLLRPENGPPRTELLLERAERRAWYAVPANARDCSLAAGPIGVAIACVVDGVVHLVDAKGTQPFERLSSRARAHHPSLACVAGRWALAWVSEDTGKLVMARAIVGGDVPARIAEVWAPLDRPWTSSPVMVGDRTGGWVAWREERGPRAAAYLRRLDQDARQEGREVRLSDRSATTMPGRIGLVSTGERVACAAWIEQRGDERQVWMRTVRFGTPS